MSSMRKIAQNFGRFIKSKMNYSIIELVGTRKESLVKDVLDYFGDEALFVVTLKGYEENSQR